MSEVRKPDDSITFDKHDIAAVANARYFKRGGIKLLLIWAAVTLVIVMITNYTGIIPVSIAYILLFIEAIVFVYLYSKKQTEMRVKLWENIERNRVAKQSELQNSD
jgi:hypothetical protein